MNILSVENISKAYGEKELFQNISFGIDEGQKIALVGLNGTGKTSLLKLLAKLEAPDSGRITYRKGITVAYLPQVPDMDPEKTIKDTVIGEDHPIPHLIEEFQLLIQQPDPSKEQESRIEQLNQLIDAKEAWSFERQAEMIISKLGINFPKKRIGTLSGGQQKRVALAQALIRKPDLLILDEPTNHLDIDSIEWLENLLSTNKQSLLVVTHDRYFLDRITNEILELDEGKLFSYMGNYAHFLAKKAERQQLQLTNIDKAKSLYKKELEWLRRAPKARGTKAKARIDAADELKNRSNQRLEEHKVNLMIKGRRLGSKIIELKSASKAFGDTIILDNFTYTFAKYDRIGIIGPNGIGKSTFIKLLTGELKVDSGTIKLGETVSFGHYRQEGLQFKEGQRIIESITELAETVEMGHKLQLSAAQLLEHFLFPRKKQSNRISTLSGGEKRRLHLLQILITNPNFLILDEPTNDLDLHTLRILEEFLQDFEGCLLTVSHDRFFMDKLVNHIFAFEGKGSIKDFPGNYSQYRNWKKQTDHQPSEQQEKRDEPISAKDIKKTKEAQHSSRKLSYKEKREFEGLETEIEQLEERKVKLNELLNSGEQDYQKLTDWTAELQQLNKALEEKTDRWLELSERA